MTIPRTVNINHAEGKIGMDTPVSSQLEDRVARETWPTRYEQLISATGYNTGRVLLKAMPIAEWEKLVKISLETPASLYIDGLYFFYGTRENQKFVDLSLFKFWKKIRQPIHYYLVNEQRTSENSGEEETDKENRVARSFGRLVNLLQEENFALKSKSVRTREGEPRSTAFLTMAPDIIVDIMDDAYNLEPPSKNVIIVSRDQLLTPVIKKLRQIGVTVTLAIANNQYLSNHYMYQFNYIVDLISLLDSGKVTTAERHTHHHRDTAA